jgi:AbrB family looped-hinge helix DNA binding protein
MKKKQTHFMSTVKVGIKGQIVIPKEIRDMFEIEHGTPLIIMADSKRGIALQKASILDSLANKIFDGKGKEELPDETEDHLDSYAKEIKKTLHNKS